MKLNVSVRNSHGFSLIEIVVAMGLIGVITIVVMNLTKVSNDSVRNMTSSMDLNTIHGAIESSISTSKGCYNTLINPNTSFNKTGSGNVNFSGGVGPQVGDNITAIYSRMSVPEDAVIVAQTFATAPGGSQRFVKIESMRLEETGSITAPGEYQINLVVEYFKTVNTNHNAHSEQRLFKKIPLYVNLIDSGGALVLDSCYGMDAATSPQALCETMLGGTLTDYGNNEFRCYNIDAFTGELSAATRDNPTYVETNIGIGAQTMVGNTTTEAINPDTELENIGIGYRSFYRSMGRTNLSNIGIGPEVFSLLGPDMGIENNIAIGKRAASTFEDDATFPLPIADKNIAIGFESMFKSRSPSKNIALGEHALSKSRNGVQNISIGERSMIGAYDPQENIVIGNNALSEDSVTVSSIQWGGGVYSPRKNIVIGNNAFRVNQMTMAAGAPNYREDNVIIGNNTMNVTFQSRISPNAKNTLVGSEIAHSSTASDFVGVENSIFGHAAAKNINSGNRNVFLGSASANTFIGGDDNTFVGNLAGAGLRTGSKNIVIGNQASIFDTATTSVNLHENLIIGNESRSTQGYNTLIGSGLTATGTNQLLIGRNAVSSVDGFIGLGTCNTGAGAIVNCGPTSGGSGTGHSFIIHGSTAPNNAELNFNADTRFAGNINLNKSSSSPTTITKTSDDIVFDMGVGSALRVGNADLTLNTGDIILHNGDIQLGSFMLRPTIDLLITSINSLQSSVSGRNCSSSTGTCSLSSVSSVPPGWASSDRRIKDIVGKLDFGIDEIMQLDVMEYYLHDYNHYSPLEQGYIRQGIIAQELQKIIPRAVKEIDGILHIDKDLIFWTTVKAIQDIQNEVLELKQVVEALKAKNEEQEKRIAKLEAAMEKILEK